MRKILNAVVACTMNFDCATTQVYLAFCSSFDHNLKFIFSSILQYFENLREL